MLKKKISLIIVAAVISNFSTPAIITLADEVQKEKAVLTETQGTGEENSTDAIVKKFDLLNNENIEGYNKVFKIEREKIKSITNNGGQYGSSSINKAIDGDIKTHWETGTPNRTDFKNEVIIELTEPTMLNRIVYGARRDSAMGKGFARKFKLYASTSESGDDFTLVCDGDYSKSNSDIVQIKFKPTEFKRLKFVFDEANQDWASAVEFMLYKPDDVLDKMNRLFKDDTLSQVSEEFNTVEKLDALEEEAKTHPLYNSFKEDIENAKIILKSSKIEAEEAKVEKFNLQDNEEYNKLFEIDKSNIESISNNGGQYSSQNIKNAIDGDLKTYWETGRANGNNFNNEVEVTFKNNVKLSRVVYGARPSDNKGFAEQFDIYGSTTSKGDTYQLVATGSYSKTSGFIEAKFKEAEFKRLKFVFKKSDQNWATLSELKFYKNDELADKVENIFTDKTYSDLKPEFKNSEYINNLEQEVQNHPLKDELASRLNIAKDILNNKIDSENTKFVATQYGDLARYGSEVLSMSSMGENFQVTGLYALPGDKLKVYVNAEAGKPMPRLIFSQNEGSYSSWRKTVNLHTGINEITVPIVNRDGNYKSNPKPGGSIYIENPYTPEEQGQAPIIRIEGAQRFPLFKKGDNEEEFKNFLVEYKKKLDEDNAAGTNKVLDIAEVDSDRMTLSGTTTGAYDAYINQGVKPSETTTFWDQTMAELFKYYGFDGSSEVNNPKNIKEHMRLAQPFGAMYASGDHVGVQKSAMSAMLNPNSIKGGYWGFIHEIGHRMDTNGRTWGEVTNNMLPMHMGVQFNNIDNRIPYESEIYPNVAPNERDEEFVHGHYFESLGLFWQLQMYDENYWPNLNKLYRERKPSPKNEQEKRDIFVEYSSDALNLDLSEYFRRHGFVASKETLDKLAKYNKPSKKIWYLNNSSINYKGPSIDESAKPVMNSEIEENNFRQPELKFSSDIPNDELLGYEITRNDEVIGFTTKTSFTDKTAKANTKYEYKVRAYGKDLSTSSESEPVNYEIQRAYVGFNKSNWEAKTNYLTVSGMEAPKAIDEKYSKYGVFQTRRVTDDEIKKGITNPMESPYLLIDMKENKDFDGFEYYNATSDSNGKGMVKTYNLYISNDGKNFTKIVDNEDIPQASERGRKEVLLDKTYNARFIKFECVQSAQKDGIMTVSEFSPINKEKDIEISNIEIVSENNKKEINGLDESIKLTAKTKPIGATLKEVEWKAVDSKTGEESKAVKLDVSGENVIVTPNSTGKVETVKVVATSKYNKEVMDEITITSNASQLAEEGVYKDIEKNNWTAETSAPTDWRYAPNKAVDGKTGEYDIFQSASQEGTKYLTIDMKNEFSFNGFAYHNKANGNSTEGQVKRYNLYISDDGENFTKIVDNGVVPRADVKERKNILLDKTYTARYIRFECLETQFGDNKMAVLEFSPFTTEKNIPINKMEITSKNGTQEIYEINTIGEGIDLDAKIYPENATDKDVMWKVVDAKTNEPVDEYVTIDENGVLKGTGVAYDGEIKIIATSKADNKIEAEAKGLVVNNTDLNTISTMSKFNLLNNESLPKYDKKYKENIVAISNNGRQYGSSSIDKAIDGNRNTHWETGTPNSDNFTNEVILTMENGNDVVDRLVYATRQDGARGKGFPLEYELYASNTESGNTFRKVAEGSYSGNTGDFVEIKFTPTKAKRFKFVFKNAKDGWASASEFWMYKEDKLRATLDDLFVDSSKNELKEQYKDISKINELENQLENYELKDYYKEDVEKAKDLISKKPEIKVEDSTIIHIKDSFNAMDGVRGIDNEDGNITDKIVVKENNVDTSKAGVYKILYELTDSSGRKTSKERRVIVTTEEEYLSDIDWTKATSGWRTVQKDKSVQGNKLTLKGTDENKSYDKGIGTHSNSEIVYDLSGKDYSYFMAKVGVDQEVSGNSASSVIFQVYLDGNKVYDSGMMKSGDLEKDVFVETKGAKELKLVVNDGGNGNSSDHADFADAKLLVMNSKPVLKVEEDAVTKVGQPLESITGKYTATDVEDGDLTSKVVIGGNVDFNKAGIYRITYSVEDSDGNTTEATRIIKVIDMKNSTYLSDIDWISANNTYAKANKDISVSGNQLRLTDENGQSVTYEKGIGTHSTSTIKYDLTKGNYGYFSSYVGVDRQMYGTVGSVTFEVWLDNKKVYDSGLMNSTSTQKYIEVNLKGAKELKIIVTDGGNGNGSDHATFGDAKLYYVE